MLQRIAVLWFILCIWNQSGGYKKDYMNSTSGRLRRQEEGSCGNLCDWIRGKMETFFALVATGWLTFIVSRDSVRVGKLHRGLGKRITLAFQT